MGSVAYLGPATGFLRKHGLHRNPVFRRMAFKVLSLVGRRDISIGHHWVPGAKIRLNVFRHRGYWFHGKKRERGAMLSFARLVRPGNTIVEVGGHIGYITTYLASLAGAQGKVVVLEPSPDNLHYLKYNVAPYPHISIVEKAASDREGTARFFVEDLTGQNSTLMEDYGNFSHNRESAFSGADYRTITVDTIPLDVLFAQTNIKPQVMKIDVEGAELLALQGMTQCLRDHRPKLMVEVTEHESEVMQLLADAGYTAFKGDLTPIEAGGSAGPNRFFIPVEQVASVFKR